MGLTYEMKQMEEILSNAPWREPRAVPMNTANASAEPSSTERTITYEFNWSYMMANVPWGIPGLVAM